MVINFCKGYQADLLLIGGTFKSLVTYWRRNQRRSQMCWKKELGKIGAEKLIAKTSLVLQKRIRRLRKKLAVGNEQRDFI